MVSKKIASNHLTRSAISKKSGPLTSAGHLANDSAGEMRVSKEERTQVKFLSTIAVSFLFCCTVLALGANHKTQKNDNPSDDHRVILSLTTESSAIKKSQPFFVTLTIKNRSGKEFSFQASSKPTLNLEAEGQSEEAKKRLGPNYWSWISILAALPADSQIRRREILLDGEEVSVRLDLSKLDWGHSILSGYPSKTVFPTVPGGRYILSFEFDAKEGKEFQTLKSNELYIQVL